MPVKKQIKNKKAEPVKKAKPVHFFKAIGRRKTAVASVRLQKQGQREVLINDKSLDKYFAQKELQEIALSPFDKMNSLDKFNVSIKVKGGGLHAQAEAVRHAISRALIDFNPEFRKRLKKAGFLTRDSRMRERKKFGLKRARRAPQWRKR
ncbi:MAG: 30S ribosomal protein S9 [Candidatus Nealsonbacteria bacterium]|nr:30S ribosomal protein S9 [Candidatus Nealsonbacteria bacterium]